MRPALDPASPVLRRDAEHLQVGTDPQDAVVLRDLPGVVELLRRCDGVRQRGDVLGAGADPTVAADLGRALDALLDVGVLVDTDEQLALGAAAGEPARLVGLGLAAARATVTVAARRTRAVRVVGPSVLAEPLAALLSDCGVPIHADSPPATAWADGSRPDLAVVVGHPEPDRDTVDSLVRSDVDHLVVALHARSALLGPLVRPGQTACVRCADAARADADPPWMAMVPQLDSPVQRPVGAPWAGSPLLVATVVAAAAAAVLACLDGVPTPCDGAVLRWGADCGLAAVHPITAHPDCGCSRLTLTRRPR